MLCLNTTLIAGANHEEFVAGEPVAALIFVVAEDLESAENIVAQKLCCAGWVQMETGRVKKFDESNISTTSAVVAQAIQNARETGFGIVIYPEPSAVH